MAQQPYGRILHIRPQRRDARKDRALRIHRTDASERRSAEQISEQGHRKDIDSRIPADGIRKSRIPAQLHRRPRRRIYRAKPATALLRIQSARRRRILHIPAAIQERRYRSIVHEHADKRPGRLSRHLYRRQRRKSRTNKAERDVRGILHADRSGARPIRGDIPYRRNQHQEQIRVWQQRILRNDKVDIFEHHAHPILESSIRRDIGREDGRGRLSIRRKHNVSEDDHKDARPGDRKVQASRADRHRRREVQDRAYKRRKEHRTKRDIHIQGL